MNNDKFEIERIKKRLQDQFDQRFIKEYPDRAYASVHLTAWIDSVENHACGLINELAGRVDVLDRQLEVEKAKSAAWKESYIELVKQMTRNKANELKEL